MNVYAHKKMIFIMNHLGGVYFTKSTVFIHIYILVYKYLILAILSDLRFKC